MIDLSRTHRKGIAVADIERAVADYGAVLGLAFAPVRDFDALPFWTARAGFGCARPTRWVGRSISNGCRAIAISMIPPGRPARLSGLGGALRAANMRPEAGYGMIAYCGSPDGALLVELSSTALKPAIDAWLGE